MNQNQVDADDEDDFTFFCCFKIKKEKQNIQNERSRLEDSSDKLSLQKPNENNILIRSPVNSDLAILRQEQQFIKITDFRNDKIVILRNKSTNQEIIAKITEKQCSAVDLSSSLLGYDSPKSQLSDQLSALESTPESVARYISKRTRDFGIVTDLGCGAGGNTVQLAKECNYVVGIEIDNNLIQLAQQNCNIHKVQVDLICADIFSIKNWKTDIIFINPNLTLDENHQCRDIINGSTPNISKIFQKHQKQISNFIIQLPPTLDLSEIPKILNLHEQFSNYSKGFPAFSHIEIEAIYICRQLEYFVIYCGEVANINESEILRFLVKQFRKIQSDKKNISKQQLYFLIELINHQIGLFHLSYRVIEAIKQKKSIENFCQFIRQHYALDQDLYQSYKYHYHNKDDIYSVSKQDADEEQDMEFMSPGNFSYKIIETSNIQPSYTFDNGFDEQQQDDQQHSSSFFMQHH